MDLSTQGAFFDREHALPSLYRAIDIYKEHHGRQYMRYIFLHPKNIDIVEEECRKLYLVGPRNEDINRIMMFCGLHVIPLPDLDMTTVMVAGIRR